MRRNEVSGKLRVLIADDHCDVRRAITSVLSAEFDVIGAAADGKALLREALALRPDVIVTDMAMPFFTGPEVMNELKAQGHDIPFVLISGAFAGIDELIRQGAMAIVSKLDITDELAHAVRSAALREVYTSRDARLRSL